MSVLNCFHYFCLARQYITQYYLYDICIVSISINSGVQLALSVRPLNRNNRNFLMIKTSFHNNKLFLLLYLLIIFTIYLLILYTLCIKYSILCTIYINSRTFCMPINHCLCSIVCTLFVYFYIHFLTVFYCLCL